MDNETKQMFQLIINKLDKVETRLDKMDSRLDKMDSRLDKMDSRLDKMDSRLDKMDSRLDKMDSRLDNIERKQDEMYLMQRALEENVKVTRAEQEKMIYIVADIQGKVTTLTEEVEEHEKVINQIKAI